MEKVERESFPLHRYIEGREITLRCAGKFSAVELSGNNDGNHIFSNLCDSFHLYFYTAGGN